MSIVVTIRPLRVEDAPTMAVVLGSPELYTHIGGLPPTEEELARRYVRQTAGLSPDGAQEWMNWIVLDDDQTATGYVQAGRAIGSATADIAWVIGRPWQRQGRATAGARLMVQELAKKGVAAVTADIHPDNLASQGVARRLGMTPTREMIDGEVRWTGRISITHH